MTSAAASRYARALVDVVTDPASGSKPGEALEELRADTEDLMAHGL